MDFSVVKRGLEGLLGVVTTLAPIAKSMGGDTVTKIAGLVETGLSIANNALERIKDGTVVADSRDEAVVRAIITDLQAENDKLAKAIDAS